VDARLAKIVPGRNARFAGIRSRTGSLNRSASGQALRDDNVRRLCDSFCRGERLFARDWISVQAKGMTEEVLIREDPRGWHPFTSS
jgi:hypothetical protein